MLLFLTEVSVGSQLSGTDLGFTFSGLLLVGLVLLLVLVIAVCMAVRINRRRGKKYTRRMDRSIALRDIEVNPTYTNEDIYTGMPPRRGRRAPNYTERSDSLLKLDLNAVPDIPGKSEQFYDTLTKHSKVVKGCEVETEAYGNLDEMDVTDA